jgi:hypothetical protein
VRNSKSKLWLAIPLLTVISACDGSPAAPSSGGSSGYDGQWSGTTFQGARITFTVAAQKVTAITVGYNFNGCSGANSGCVPSLVENENGVTSC